jgi:hypothetical protein
MISKILKEILEHRDLNSDIDFQRLIYLFEQSDIEFITAELDSYGGVAINKKVIYDYNTMIYGDSNLILFLLLHEYCHALRVNKFGYSVMINFFIQDSFDIFKKHIIEEEIIADRFASYYYYCITGIKVPDNMVQQLEISDNANKYGENIKPFFYSINSIDDYDKVLNDITIR